MNENPTRTNLSRPHQSVVVVARNIIVIGASAGGLEAIQQVIAGLPFDLPAAVFITLHQFERSPGLLPQILNRAGPLLAIHPWEESPIEMGRIYVAPPDFHLILTPKTVHLSHGPKENLQRPCINTMFRSAAAAHGEHVAGVVLTGLLDDGAAGLWEIQQRGGATIAQDPKEAPFPSMPESAIRGSVVQYILRVGEMAPLLTRLAMGDYTSVPDLAPAPAHEEPSVQACPECGGAMKLHRLGRLKEYTCHVGHRFSTKAMIAEKTEVVERAMWTALSQSEELSSLLEQVTSDGDGEGTSVVEEELAQRRHEQELLRTLIERTKALSSS
jgi:two-component system chemotaxis response regulator CheB